MQRLVILLAVLAILVLSQAIGGAAPSQDTETDEKGGLDLGHFSVSLTVKDLEASRAFYEKLGFTTFGGDAKQNWLILQNDRKTTIGLFQGMFERNIMSFNPGWTSSAEKLEEFTDIRELQRIMKDRGLVPDTEADETTTGPASLILTDPDGNPILIDQHV